MGVKQFYTEFYIKHYLQTNIYITNKIPLLEKK